MKTIAVIIGVSRYSDLEDLPAAENDALLFARALRNWGIKEDNLFIFLNETATPQALQQCFEALKAFGDPFKLIFYFCGHGARSAAPDPNSYLLLGDHPYPLERLIQEIYHLNSEENALFIDACHLRINTLINPKLKNEIRQKKDQTKSFFCLLSSGIGETFEDVAGEYGYFTRALLKALSQMRTGKNNLTEFLDTLYAQLQANELPLPEMYNFETRKLNFFPKLMGRHAFMAYVQDQIVAHPDKILCLVGEKGIGKTTIGKQLASEKCRSFYTKEVPSSVPLHALMILDAEVTGTLPRGAQWVLLTRHTLKHVFREKVLEIEVPPVGLEEAALFLDETLDAKTKELIFLAAKGNPQKIRQILQHSPFEESSSLEHLALSKAVAAVAACGGYLNEELFALTHEIDLNHLIFIEKIGLIRRSSNGWVAHEYLIEVAQIENLPFNKGKAIAYWCRQLDQTPQDTIASQSLILTLKCLGYHPELESYLAQAVTNLAKDPYAHLAFFEDGADIYLAHKAFTPTTLQLVDIFLEMGLLDKAEDLLNLTQDEGEAALRRQQCLWRQGRYGQVQKASLPEGSAHLSCCLHRGCASFFLGEWDKALKDFQKVFENAQGSLKYLALCMSGSVLALSGRDTHEGRRQLETATRLLTEQRDLKGAWVCWNNLGELLWKIGEYRSAHFHLQRAFELAFNSSTRLETARNFLELALRTKGPFAKETEELMERLSESKTEPYEEMQRLNTLAFAYLLRGERELAEQAIKAAVPLTQSNPQMHRTTCLNFALLKGDESLITQMQEEKSLSLIPIVQEAIALFKKYQGTDYARSPASFT